MVIRRFVLALVGSALAVAFVATGMTSLVKGPLAIASAAAAEPIRVVASFSVLADMAREIGGERVAVTALVGPGGDVHTYEPKPTDAQAVRQAKLLVVNGLGLEGWMGRLQQAAGFKGLAIVASRGIKSEMMEEDGKRVTDPHAWQDLANGRLYAMNIRDGLIGADPEGKAIYQANAARYVAAIDALEPEVKAALASIPPERRKIITSHDAFGYFGRAYGLAFIAPEGVSTESEPSAQDVAKIIRQIKAERIPAVFLENVTDPRLIEQIGRESGARIGGALFSDALSPPDGPAASYLAMFRHNVKTLVAALGPQS